MLPYQKDIIGADHLHLSKTFQYFDSTVKARAKDIYENPDRFENDPDSFKGAR